MARPTTKPELILAANQQYNKLWSAIDALSQAQQAATFGYDPAAMGTEAHWARDKNLRDVLVHLYEWHMLLLNWVAANQAGKAKPFLQEPYNWKNYGLMNVGFWEKHQATPYEEAKRMLADSHHRVMALIESFSTEELFTKGTFPWVGGSTLGSYCVSCTSSHYDWAQKKVKAHKKAFEERK
jgi:hypothetical protein